MEHKIEWPSKEASSRSRLPLLTLQDLTAAQLELHRAIVASPRGQVADSVGRLRGPFNAMLLRPRIGAPLEQLGTALRFRGELADRSREIAILLVSRHTGCAYEWQAHEPIAHSVGVTDAEIDSLRSGEELLLDTWSEHDLMLMETVRGMLIDGDLTDDFYARAVAVLSPSDVFELTVLVGYYSLLALQLRVFRVYPGSDSPIPVSSRSRDDAPE